MSKAMLVIDKIKTFLNDDSFKAEHRRSPAFFSRNRKLAFVVMILPIVRKSLKSAQLVLNEFFCKI
jgi:hypothetical protein